MKIFRWGRQTGKTTECVRVLRETPDAALFVHSLSTRALLPKDIQDRVFSYQSEAWRGRSYMKAILDDPDYFVPKKKAKVAEVQSRYDIKPSVWKKMGKDERGALINSVSADKRLEEIQGHFDIIMVAFTPGVSKERSWLHRMIEEYGCNSTRQTGCFDV